MKQIKRRSIVQFEAWLDAEIAQVEDVLNKMEGEANDLAQRQAKHKVQMETLLGVKAKLAPVSAEDEAEIPEPVAVEIHEATPSLFGMTEDEANEVEVETVTQ